MKEEHRVDYAVSVGEGTLLAYGTAQHAGMAYEECRMAGEVHSLAHGSIHPDLTFTFGIHPEPVTTGQ